MDIISITSNTFTITQNQIFSIVLSDPLRGNCSWITTIPSSLILFNRIHHTTCTPHSNEWLFIASELGSYELKFSYQKHCCGHPILKTETYAITILPAPTPSYSPE